MEYRRKGVLFFFSLALFLCAAAFAAAQPFAVLKTGPEQRWEIPGFEKNTIRCLYGAYELQNGSRVQVWAVPVHLEYPPLWQDSKLSNRLRIFKQAETGLYSAYITLKNQNAAMQGMLNWTVVFESEPDAAAVDISAFISVFAARFEYFGSIVKGMEDMSFPAVLENGKN